MSVFDDETPLLSSHHDLDAQIAESSHSHRSELSILCASALPLICTSLLQSMQVSIALLFVGRMGKEELAAVALATLTANVTGWSVFQGLTSALDTLCPRAHGAGLYKLVGLHTQRMAVLLLCTSVPISIFWYNSYRFIQLLIDDDEICTMAQKFMRILILGCPGYAFFECGKRFLQAQGHFAAGLYTLIVVIPIHILTSWYLGRYLDLGVEGIALALSTTRNLLPLGLVIYSHTMTDGGCWRPLDKLVLKDWSLMIKISLPSLVMYEADTIAFEILDVMAGKMGTSELGANTLLITFCSFIYRVPSSLGIATGTEIGHRLGEGCANLAREAARMGMYLAAGVACTAFVLLTVLHDHIPWIMTSDRSIVVIMQEALPIMAGFMFIDSFVGVMNGIIRGVGAQSYGAKAQLFGCYVVGLPICASTAFGLGWRVKGLLTGITAAMAAVAALEGNYLWRLDWMKLVQNVRNRDAQEVETAEEYTAFV